MLLGNQPLDPFNIPIDLFSNVNFSRQQKYELWK